MTSPHPNLDERDRLRHERLRRMLIGLGSMAAVMVLGLVIIFLNAGKWGVPMFGFTNERGSQCRNDFFGYTCSPMTLGDVEHRLGVDVPEDAVLVSSTWKETHDFDLRARLVYPQASARAGWESLSAEFGDCQPNEPSPLSDVPDLSGLCVMTNDVVASLDGTPDPRIWRIATATQADGDTLVDIHLRSR